MNNFHQKMVSKFISLQFLTSVFAYISQKYSCLNQYDIFQLFKSKLIFVGIINIYFLVLISLLVRCLIERFLVLSLLSILYAINKLMSQKGENTFVTKIYFLILHVMIILCNTSLQEAILFFLIILLQGKSKSNVNQILNQSLNVFLLKIAFNPSERLWEIILEVVPLIYILNQMPLFVKYKKGRSITTLGNLNIANTNSTSLNPIHSSEQFTTSIIHDLRNPVGIVHSILEIIINDENISLLQKDQLDTALFSCDFLLMIINNILDLAKIRANKFQLQITDFSLPKIIKMIIKMESNLAKRKNLKYSVQIVNTLPEIVKGDKTRISQIILNLIGNAIKFTEKGCIQIRVSWEKDLNCIDFSDESLHKSIPGSGKYKSIERNSSASSKSIFSEKMIECNWFTYFDELNNDELSIDPRISNYKSISKRQVDFSHFNMNEPTYKENHRPSKSEFFLNTDDKYIKIYHQENKSNFIPLNFDSKFDSESKEGMFCVEIADSGEGIKQEDQNKLFKPFSQGKSKTEAIGTGLGLWISKLLIEIMNGKIKLYSIYGIGTVVRVYIPLQLVSSQTYDMKGLEKNPNSDNSRCSPLAPKHFGLNKNSQIKIKFLTDDQDTLIDLHKIPSSLQKEKINTLISIHEFSDEIDYKYWNDNPIIILICQKDIEKLIEIIENIKQLEKDFNYPQFHIIVFKKSTLELPTKIKEIIFDQGEYSLYGIVCFIKESFGMQKARRETPTSFEDAFTISKMDRMNKSLFIPFILIADDDVLSRSTIKYMLNSLGYEKIYEAENGEQAIKRFSENFDQIKLIILDKRMPKMNGIEACKELRKLEIKNNLNIPIIGLTGDKDNNDFISAGATIVIDKPMKHDDLSNLINQFLI